MPRDPRWRDDELRSAVAAATSMAEVARTLRLQAGGGTYASLRRHIERLHIDDSHIPRLRSGRPVVRKNWSDDDLSRAVRESASFAEVQRRLGYRPSGGIHRMMTRHIARLGLSTAHFSGQGWARGTRNVRGFPAVPLEEILVQNSSYGSSARLRRRLIAAGLKSACCEMCGLVRWRGAVLPLELDHVNGDSTDNRLENLRILCPNCHSQTETWCVRK